MSKTTRQKLMRYLNKLEKEEKELIDYLLELDLQDAPARTSSSSKKSSGENNLAELYQIASKLPSAIIKTVLEEVYTFHNNNVFNIISESEELMGSSKIKYQLFNDKFADIDDDEIYADFSSFLDFVSEKPLRAEVIAFLATFERVQKAETQICYNTYLQGRKFLQGKISEKEYYTPIIKKAIEQRERFLPDNIQNFADEYVTLTKLNSIKIARGKKLDNLVKKYFDI